MELVSRKEAIARGLDRYFTGKPCKRGHFSERYTKFTSCIACLHEYRERPESKEWLKQYNAKRRNDPRYLEIEKTNRQKPERKLAKAEYLKTEKMKQWRRKHQKTKEKNDEVYRFARRARVLIRGSFNRSGNRKPEKTEKILGCDILTFKQHIESLFVDGMTWNNMSEWHIDHIIPLASAKTLEEQKALCHYTNLQPLWAKENLKKGAKILPTPIDTSNPQS
jgi:hypothetical protein